MDNERTPGALGSNDGLGPLPEDALRQQAFLILSRLQSGTEDVVRLDAALAAVAEERERWRAAAEYAAHQLEQARIWNGMDWHYNPLHPLHYRSALERLRDVLRA